MQQIRFSNFFPKFKSSGTETQSELQTLKRLNKSFKQSFKWKPVLNLVNSPELSSNSIRGRSIWTLIVNRANLLWILDPNFGIQSLRSFNFTLCCLVTNGQSLRQTFWTSRGALSWLASYLWPDRANFKQISVYETALVIGEIHRLGIRSVLMDSDVLIEYSLQHNDASQRVAEKLIKFVKFFSLDQRSFDRIGINPDELVLWMN